MGLEIEWKYSLNEETMAAVQTAFGPWERICMETTYYDTADLQLSDRKITLRRRMENAVSVCTLKVPAAGGARGEWEVPNRDLEQALPVLIDQSGLQELAQLPPVKPVCGARFTRLACTWVLPECTVEIAMDKGVLTGGGKEIPLQELEVELKSGDTEAARAFCKQLERTYGLQPEARSKFQRARALVKG